MRIDNVFRRPQNSSLLMCALAAGLLAWAGCDSPEGGGEDRAKSQQPESSPEKSAPSAGNERPGSASNDKPTPSGDEDRPGAASNDKPTPPGGENAPGSAGGPSGEGSDVTDAELEKFVEVTKKLKPRRAEFKRALHGAESKAEAKKAQKKVMKATRKAAEEVGLEFERFREISRQVKNSPDLQAKLRALSQGNDESSE